MTTKYLKVSSCAKHFAAYSLENSGFFSTFLKSKVRKESQTFL